VFPERPICGGSDEGNDNWCIGIENVALSTGALTDAGGDGGVSPGEDAAIIIVMRNDGPDGCQDPCIGLLADNPAVTIVGGEAHDNPAWNFFGIPAGQSLEVLMHFRFEASLAPGTKVTFLAWYDALGAACTNGNEIEFAITAQ
jgi:hypothetical protein